MQEWIDKLLRWIKDVVPTVTAVGSMIYNYMLRRLDKEERAHDKTKLEKEKLENEIQVKKDNSSKSDRDVIMDAVAEGNGGDSGTDNKS